MLSYRVRPPLRVGRLRAPFGCAFVFEAFAEGESSPPQAPGKPTLKPREHGPPI